MPQVPPTPTGSDWYLVVPLPATPAGAVSAQVFVVPADDMDQAAQWARDRGHPTAAIVLATWYGP